MRQLIHILYVTEKDIELHLRGEALEAKQNETVIAHVPLHNLEGIVSFSYMPATPALMAACAERQIAFSVLNRLGRLQYRIEGRTRGNPELRLRQFMGGTVHLPGQEERAANQFVYSRSERISSAPMPSVVLTPAPAKHPNHRSRLQISKSGSGIRDWR